MKNNYENLQPELKHQSKNQFAFIPIILRIIALAVAILGICVGFKLFGEFYGNILPGICTIIGSILSALLFFVASIIVEACNKYLSQK